MIVKVMLLLGLLGLLRSTQKPLLCSTIYAVVVAVFGLVLGVPLPILLVRTAVGFAGATLYFWLLNQLTGLAYFGVMVLGLVLGLV